MATVVEELISKFHAQDLSTYMDALVDGVMIRVATFNDATQSWSPTQAGRDLVNPPEEVEEKPKPKNIDVRPQGKPATGLGKLPDL